MILSVLEAYTFYFGPSVALVRYTEVVTLFRDIIQMISEEEGTI